MDWFIETSPAEIRACAVNEHGTITQVCIERLHRLSLVGAVYRGRVRATDSAMGGVFVDIGLPKINGQDNWAFLPQGKGLTIGDAVVVQVTRDAFGGKSVGLSRQIAYYDRYFTLRHSIKGVQYDRKLGQGLRRAETEKSLRKALENRHNVLVLPPAHALDCDIFEQRLETAMTTWQDWLNHTGDAPVCLCPAPRTVDSIFMRADTDDRIMFATAKEAKQWEKPLHSIAPDLWDAVMTPDTKDGDLFTIAGLNDGITDLLERHIPLDGGGGITIDHTEAMTVIDVNSSGATGLESGVTKGGDEALNRINKKACKAIAHHILALNLAGMIVIDFITIKNKGVLKRLTETMRAECRKRGLDVDVLGMTVGGLMELTRKRTSPSLIELLCHHKGATPTPTTMGAELLRTTVNQAHHQRGVGHPEIIAPQAVIDCIKHDLKDAYAETNRIMGQDVILTVGNIPQTTLQKPQTK